MRAEMPQSCAVYRALDLLRTHIKPLMSVVSDQNANMPIS